ncbi:MAG TPA: site-specific integrase [Candidatus Acidoferrales bacterium]|nr:site-specific integrase [Candidatus Acidoferrales bacterium]
MLMKDLSDYCDRNKVREILNYAKTASRRDYLILKVLWESGMRVSELAALTPRDLEPQNHAIVSRNGKGNKAQRVYVDYKTGTMAMLYKYISAMKIPEDAPIFGMKTNQLRNIVKKYGLHAGVNMHPHSFRHSFAINIVRQGTDLRRVQQLLGHTNLNTTAVYLQFKDADIK